MATDEQLRHYEGLAREAKKHFGFAICPECGREFELVGGRIPNHVWMNGDSPAYICRGSQMPTTYCLCFCHETMGGNSHPGRTCRCKGGDGWEDWGGPYHFDGVE